MSNPARGVYQTLRAHDRAVEKASVRAHERGSELAKANQALARLNPYDGLHAVGHACTVHASDEHHAALQRGSTLLRWCGRDDTLIDRHDARALLDAVREAPLPWKPGPRPGPRLSDDAAREERLAAFERYRDLVRLLRRGLGGAEQPRGLQLVEAEALQRRVAAVGHTAPTAREVRGSAVPVPAPLPLPAGSDDDDDGSDDSEDEQAASLAKACGIADYGWHVRDEKRRAAEAAGASGQQPHITKRDRKRARRRILEAERNGQAPPADAVALLKEAAEAALNNAQTERGRPGERGHSPSYAPYRPRGSSRSASPRRRAAAAAPEPAPVKEFISEFAMPASAATRGRDSDDDSAMLFHDAPEPALRPPPAAAPPARRPAAPPAAAPARKETPSERLKRLMSAQLNQQIAKDAAAEAAKLHAVARERAVIARRDDAARDVGIRPAALPPPRAPLPDARRARSTSRDGASRSRSPSRSRSRRSRSHSRRRRRSRSSRGRSSSSSSDSRRHRRRSRSRSWRRHRSRSRSRRRSRSTTRSRSRSRRRSGSRPRHGGGQ